MGKKIRNLCLMLSLSIPLIFNLFLAVEVKPGELNNQALAQQLANSKVDYSQAKGWADNKSTIFTTIFNQDGTYRGYLISQLTKADDVDNLHAQYKQDAKNSCSLSQVNKIEVEYEGEITQGVDIICMQSVGNEGVADIENGKVTINRGYGQVDGYLVGVKVVNSTFTNIKGGVLSDDILYVTSDDGGSASIEVKQQNEEQNKNLFNVKKYIPIFLITIGFVLLIVILTFIIVKVVKKTKNKKDPVVEMETDYQSIIDAEAINVDINNDVVEDQEKLEQQIMMENYHGLVKSTGEKGEHYYGHE